MTAEFNSAYDKLLAAWKRREDLRASRADFHALVEAKRDLDIARIEMTRVQVF